MKRRYPNGRTFMEVFPPYISSILKMGEQEGFRSEEYNNSKCAVILFYFLFRV